MVDTAGRCRAEDSADETEHDERKSYRVGMDDLVTWARETARGKLADALPRRWEHVQAVGAQAARIAKAFEPQGDTLIAAALLHDIGYAPDLVKTGFHPLDGARYLRDLGVGEQLCALVAHHSAALIEAQIRGLAGQLSEFEDEATPVRDALWYCDMTSGPDGQRFSYSERIEEIRHRYGPETVTFAFLAKAADDLELSVKRTERVLATAAPDLIGCQPR